MDPSEIPFVIALRYIGGILNLAKESFDLFEYLKYPKTELEKEYLENSQYFITIKDALWCNCCIDLTKVHQFDDQKRKKVYKEILGFKTILNILKEGKAYPIKNINNEVLEGWISKLVSSEENIKLLKRMRDKSYAHTEIHDFSEVNFEDLFPKIKSLLNMSIDLFTFLWVEVLGRRPADFKFTQFEPEKFDIIKKLSLLDKNSSPNL